MAEDLADIPGRKAKVYQMRSVSCCSSEKLWLRGAQSHSATCDANRKPQSLCYERRGRCLGLARRQSHGRAWSRRCEARTCYFRQEVSARLCSTWAAWRQSLSRVCHWLRGIATARPLKERNPAFCYSHSTNVQRAVRRWFCNCLRPNQSVMNLLYLRESNRV